METATEFVVSGVPYQVTDVAGRRPAQLQDFVGPVSFHAVQQKRTCWVDGVGARHGEHVHFNEKDPAGRDVRVWRITAAAPDQFHAEPVSNY